MRLVIFISILWASFWIYGGWGEQEFWLGLAIGVFPVIIILLIWAESQKKKKSASEEYIQITKFVRTKQKRKHERLVYPSTKRPLIKIGEHEFEIIDISEGGVKFLNDKQIELGRIIQGTAELLNGKTITVNGEVSRSLNREFSLVIDPIAGSIISKEKKIVSKA